MNQYQNYQQYRQQYGYDYYIQYVSYSGIQNQGQPQYVSSPQYCNNIDESYKNSQNYQDSYPVQNSRKKLEKKYSKHTACESEKFIGVGEDDVFAVSQQIGMKIQEKKIEVKKGNLDDGLSKMADLWIGPPDGLKYKYEGSGQQQLSRQISSLRGNDYHLQNSSNSASEYEEPNQHIVVPRSQVRTFVSQVRWMLRYIKQSYRLDDTEEALLTLKPQDYIRALEELRSQIQILTNGAVNNQ